MKTTILKFADDSVTAALVKDRDAKLDPLIEKMDELDEEKKVLKAEANFHAKKFWSALAKRLKSLGRHPQRKPGYDVFLEVDYEKGEIVAVERKATSPGDGLTKLAETIREKMGLSSDVNIDVTAIPFDS